MPEHHLQGRTLLITRPQPEADVTAQQVRALHGRPLLAPALTILPPHDGRSLKQAMHALDRYQGVLITSANGARALIDAMPSSHPPPPLFAVGRKTARILEKEGWPVHVPSGAAGGERLARAVMAWRPGGAQPFLFLRAEQGREELGRLLQQAGYGVDQVVAYRAEPMVTLPAPVRHALEAGTVDATLFFSGRSAQAFVAVLSAEGDVAWLSRTTVVVISSVTEETVRKLGFREVLIASEPSSEGMLKTLCQHAWRRQSGPA